MYHCTEALVHVPLHGGSSTCVTAWRLQYMYHCMEALVHTIAQSLDQMYHYMGYSGCLGLIPHVTIASYWNIFQQALSPCSGSLLLCFAMVSCMCRL